MQKSISTREPDVFTSGLSRRAGADGIAMELHICRLETDPDWTLEVVKAAGTSTVWQNLFPSAEAANEEFLRTVAEEGKSVFLDSAKIIPFRR